MTLWYQPSHAHDRLVQSEIVGGRLRLAIAQMTREQAEGLAAGIRGELLHGP